MENQEIKKNPAAGPLVNATVPPQHYGWEGGLGAKNGLIPFLCIDSEL